jgi:hypothetical protein
LIAIGNQRVNPGLSFHLYSLSTGHSAAVIVNEQLSWKPDNKVGNWTIKLETEGKAVKRQFKKAARQFRAKECKGSPHLWQSS